MPSPNWTDVTNPKRRWIKGSLINTPAAQGQKKPIVNCSEPGKAIGLPTVNQAPREFDAIAVLIPRALEAALLSPSILLWQRHFMKCSKWLNSRYPR